MAHYAFLDENNIVVEVIVGKDETDKGTNWEAYYGKIRKLTCKRTSYNTHGNQHSGGGKPFRGNYAGIGYTYDPQRDAFIAPKPYESWILNESTLLWDPPIPMPEAIEGMIWVWNESIVNWQSIKGMEI